MASQAMVTDLVDSASKHRGEPQPPPQDLIRTGVPRAHLYTILNDWSVADWKRVQPDVAGLLTDSKSKLKLCKESKVFLVLPLATAPAVGVKLLYKDRRREHRRVGHLLFITPPSAEERQEVESKLGLTLKQAEHDSWRLVCTGRNVWTAEYDRPIESQRQCKHGAKRPCVEAKAGSRASSIQLSDAQKSALQDAIFRHRAQEAGTHITDGASTSKQP